MFTQVFPNQAEPGRGLFVRERMFRVAAAGRPLKVVAPVPWFPLQGLIRRWRPHFRPTPPRREVQQGIEVLHPRFLCVPGVLKQLDGLFMALGALWPLWRLRRRFPFRLIDAHFAYPDGYAATLLGRWLGLPVTLTLRGTEVPLSRFPGRRRRMLLALERARRVFTVADSLGRHLVSLGGRGDHILRVGNGVDLARFHPEDRAAARDRLGIPRDAEVLVSVGTLCERKGFHRVMECLPALLPDHPRLLFLVVGGAGPEGDWQGRLAHQAAGLGLEERVRLLGALPPEELRWPLAAADLFVLATRNEGWANVFLEAMACGLPVVTTDVGGNAEVVSSPDLGRIVPFGDRPALTEALDQGLRRDWDRRAILAHARANAWERRIEVLERAFREILGEEG